MLRRLQAIRRAAVVLPVLALASLLPAPSRAEQAQEPAVNLRKIRWSSESVTAPLTSSTERARLTINPGLQRSARKLLARANPVAGAVILVHAPSGKVLVWAERRRGHGRPGSVLLDTRAPAASLFKLVTSAALLDKSGIPPQTKVCIRGGKRAIERRHLEPPQKGEKAHCGPFSEALGHSRNAVFAQLVTRHLLRSDLVEMAERFGFDQPLPFAAQIGMGTLKLPYNDLQFARAAVGFRGSRLSPLGALSLAYTVAAGGQAVQTRIVESAGKYRAPTRRHVLGRVMRSWTARHLRRMMEITVHSGTSLDAFSDESGQSYLRSVRVAGKTGTLQPSRRAPTTTWFIGFAPSRRPQAVVSVLIQNGPVWRRKANEVARDVLRTYFAERGYRGVTDPLARQAD